MSSAYPLPSAIPDRITKLSGTLNGVAIYLLIIGILSLIVGAVILGIYIWMVVNKQSMSGWVQASILIPTIMLIIIGIVSVIFAIYAFYAARNTTEAIFTHQIVTPPNKITYDPFGNPITVPATVIDPFAPISISG